jgi:ABC-type lipoprotein release transport system permease subunit
MDPLPVLKLAWRDLWRNRRRTLISIGAAAFGLTMVILYTSLIEATIGDAKNQMDVAGLGHVEIYATGYRQKPQAAKAFRDPAAVIAGLSLPPGSDVSYRVLARALASSAHGSEGVEVHGVDWAAESHVAAYVDDLRAGALPAAGDPQGILVGEKLAQRLKLGVGSKLRLMASRADGEVGVNLFRVRGVFHSVSPAISQGRVLVSAAAAQELLGVEGAGHQIVIQLDQPAGADALAARLGTALGPGFESLSYGQLLPALKTMESLTGNMLFVAALFVYFLVGLGILNTALMSVLERTREFGVMMAVGTRPRRLVGLVLAESFWIATLGAAVGLALGLWLTWYGTGHAVLDMRRSVGEGMDLGGMTIRSVLHTRFSIPEGLKAATFVYLMALLVGLYPAWRVSRMRPADALRKT